MYEINKQQRTGGLLLFALRIEGKSIDPGIDRRVWYAPARPGIGRPQHALPAHVIPRPAPSPSIRGGIKGDRAAWRQGQARDEHRWKRCWAKQSGRVGEAPTSWCTYGQRGGVGLPLLCVVGDDWGHPSIEFRSSQPNSSRRTPQFRSTGRPNAFESWLGSCRFRRSSTPRLPNNT